MKNHDPQKILTTRFYTNEKRRQVTRWQFNDLTFLKIINAHATRL